MVEKKSCGRPWLACWGIITDPKFGTKAWLLLLLLLLFLLEVKILHIVLMWRLGRTDIANLLASPCLSSFRWQNVFNFRYEWIRSGCRRDLGIAFFCLNIQNSKALSLSWLTEPWDTAILIIGPKEAALLLSTSFSAAILLHSNLGAFFSSFSAAILLHSNLGAFFSYPETDVSERGGVDLSDWQN